MSLKRIKTTVMDTPMMIVIANRVFDRKSPRNSVALTILYSYNTNKPPGA